MNLNTEIFKMINGLAHKSPLLDTIMIVFSKYVPIIFMASLAAVYIYGALKRKEEMRMVAIDTLVLTAINLMLSFIIGKIYFEPRPFVKNKVNLLFSHTADASFPSDHATGTMSIAVGINKYKRIYGVIMIILSIVVGISRVYVGHHYPFDVIGAYVMVVATNYLYTKIIRDKVRNIYMTIEGILLKVIPLDKILVDKQ